ncbi:MAG: NfeD family protein [Thermoleophilia bacterium]
MAPALWAAVAGAALVVELVTVLFVAAYVAMGALAAAAVAALGGPAWAQVAALLAGTALPLAATRPMLMRAARRTPRTGRPGWRPVGRRGTVTRELRPGDPGLVRVGGDTWSGVPFLDAVIPEGTVVEVVEVDGLLAVVHPVDEGAAP